MVDYIKSLNEFYKKRILVVGDYCIDEFWHVKNLMISPESMNLRYDVSRRKSKSNPGAAGNVVCCLNALGVEVYATGIIGNDKYSKELIEMLNKRKINTSGMIFQSGMETSCFARLKSGENFPYFSQEGPRIDFSNDDEVTKNSLEQLLNFIKLNSDKLDAIIVTDYDESGIGLIQEEFLKGIVDISKKYGLLLVGNSRKRVSEFVGFTSVVSNLKESELAYGKRIISVHETSRDLISKLGLESILITRDKDGMTISTKDGKIEDIPATRSEKEIVCVCGAGDVSTCVFTLGLCSGLNHIESARLSNYAAGVAVIYPGLKLVEREELENYLKQKVL